MTAAVSLTIMVGCCGTGNDTGVVDVDVVATVAATTVEGFGTAGW